MAVSKELMSIPDFGAAEEGLYAAEKKVIASMKKAILMTAGAAVQKLMMNLQNEQEILMNISDMAIQTFNAESALLRLLKMCSINETAVSSVYNDMVKCYINDATDNVNKFGKEAINAFADGDEQRMMLLGLKRFTKTAPFNSKDARRRIADKLIAEGKYAF